MLPRQFSLRVKADTEPAALVAVLETSPTVCAWCALRALESEARRITPLLATDRRGVTFERPSARLAQACKSVTPVADGVAVLTVEFIPVGEQRELERAIGGSLRGSKRTWSPDQEGELR